MTDLAFILGAFAALCVIGAAAAVGLLIVVAALGLAWLRVRAWCVRMRGAYRLPRRVLR